MIVSPPPAEVRQIVVRTYQEFGVEANVITDLNEIILLDEGRYLARSYRVEGFMAMWLIEEGILQFYDAEGTMLRTVNLFEELEPQRKAA